MLWYTVACERCQLTRHWLDTLGHKRPVGDKCIESLKLSVILRSDILDYINHWTSRTNCIALCAPGILSPLRVLLFLSTYFLIAVMLDCTRFSHKLIYDMKGESDILPTSNDARTCHNFRWFVFSFVVCQYCLLLLRKCWCLCGHNCTVNENQYCCFGCFSRLPHSAVYGILRASL